MDFELIFKVHKNVKIESGPVGNYGGLPSSLGRVKRYDG